MITYKKNNKESGFSILAVILVIVAVIVAIGVWALSGQTNTSSSGNSTGDIQATALANDASAIKLAFDTLVVNGATPASIVFIPNTASTLTAPNMLDPVNGIQAPKPNTNAIRAGAAEPEGIWVMTRVRSPIGVGKSTSSTLGDLVPVIGVAGVKDTVCQRINFGLYGSTTIPAVTTKASGAAFVTTTPVVTSANPSTMTNASFNANLYGSPGAAVTGWTSGCVSANGVADSNFYYRILSLQ